MLPPYLRFIQSFNAFCISGVSKNTKTFLLGFLLSGMILSNMKPCIIRYPAASCEYIIKVGRQLGERGMVVD